ncbi:hypothetical protein N8I77_002766 [Diaporthe amygdali]|uniref:Cyanovirin-N domain-containing protein n=1 Tax=Phomopsis amygdali TaxID=1214568 RepID=A0AAD9WC42_PHOAM|nr:hypothetical protein N8I77_002766 [Diaporthe amygdali]
MGILLRNQYSIDMKVSTTTIVTLALAGTSSATSGFLTSCSDFALTNLNGDTGRSMMLQANCKVDQNNKIWSHLDLNTCFGWSADSCGFTYPPSGHFTDSVSSCDNNYTGGDEHFGNNFGCRGPCNGRGEVYNVFALNSYVGNKGGKLVC